MATFDTLIDNLRLSLPGALDGVIHLEIGNAIDEWCRTTDAWRDPIYVSLVAGQDTYDIRPVNEDILRVFEIRHASFDTSPVVYEDGDLFFPIAPSAADNGTTALAVVSLAPKLAQARPVSDWLPEKYWAANYQMFLHGTLFRMMGQPAKPYTSTQLSQYHGRRFRNFMAISRQEARTGGQPGAQNWRFPGFR